MSPGKLGGKKGRITLSGHLIEGDSWKKRAGESGQKKRERQSYSERELKTDSQDRSRAGQTGKKGEKKKICLDRKKKRRGARRITKLY